MTDTGTVLREKEAKLATRVKKARATLESLETELTEVRTTLKVLVNMGLAQAPAAVTEEGPGPDTLNASQTAIVSMVPEGEDKAQPPKWIIDMVNLIDGPFNGDYVRTVLWRAAKRGIIHNKNGLYWREKEEAPGSSPEASVISGPADGSQGRISHPDPEGSIPSGSTHTQASFDADLDDDDVPF